MNEKSLGPDVVEETEAKVRLIRQRLLTAQNRHMSTQTEDDGI